MIKRSSGLIIADKVERVCARKITKIIERSLCEHSFSGAESLILDIYADDKNTFRHSTRVSRIFSRLASLYLGNLDRTILMKAGLVASLHDIGKVGIRHEILEKRGALTAGEYDEIKKHPIIGYNILRRVDFLKDHLDMVLHHQEKFDGSGYPDGLKGDQISLFSRILSIVDAYDAMTDSRPYRRKLGRENALIELKKNSGTQFDSRVVDFFVDNLYNLEL